MKKKNNLNHILEEIVNQYIGDFSLQPENKTEEPIVENKKRKEKVDKEVKKEENNEDHQIMLESLREEFFTMLNTTKKIEEKKDLSDELEKIAQTFF